MVPVSRSTGNHRVTCTVLRILRESCHSAPTPGCMCTRMSLYWCYPSLASLAFVPKLQSCISSCYEVFLPVSLVPFRGQPVHFSSIAPHFRVAWAAELDIIFHLPGTLPGLPPRPGAPSFLSYAHVLSFPFPQLPHGPGFPAQCGQVSVSLELRIPNDTLALGNVHCVQIKPRLRNAALKGPREQSGAGVPYGRWGQTTWVCKLSLPHRQRDIHTLLSDWACITLSAEEEVGILLGLKKVCPATPSHGAHYLESTRWALVVIILWWVICVSDHL